MTMVFRTLDAASGRAILGWRYEPPYGVYNFDASDSEAVLAYLIDPTNRLYAIFGDPGDLEGFCSFGADAQVQGGSYAADALDIVLGLRPDLTGQGRGLDYVYAVIGFASTDLGAESLRVTIALFNSRAQRVWEQAGFGRAQTFSRQSDGVPFVVMTRDAGDRSWSTMRIDRGPEPQQRS